MPHAHPRGFPPRTLECADDGEGQVFPPPYDAGGLSAVAPPVGAPSYCIETRRALLRGFMKHPRFTCRINHMGNSKSVIQNQRA